MIRNSQDKLFPRQPVNGSASLSYSLLNSGGVEMNDMKSKLLFAVVVVSILSACTGGSPTPTASAQQSNPTQATSAAQNVPAVTLTFVSPAVAAQATTI